METVVYIYLITAALSFILRNKLRLNDYLMRSKHKVIYRLGKCNFCFNFWVGVISSLAVYLIDDWYLTPLIVAGIYVEVQDFKAKKNE